ncbi:MAG: hypothetical protein RR439_07065 [Carnobacterium sp.]
MSDREKQQKYNRENNISGSMYARVNVGQNADKNKLDSAKMSHTGGSMNNKDERVIDNNSLTYTVLYYVIGFLVSFVIGFILFRLFHNYFYNEGINELLPSLLLISISLIGGFLSSRLVLKKMK